MKLHRPKLPATDPIWKRQFLLSTVEQVKATLLADIEKIPDEWDGDELRQLIVDRVAERVGTKKLKGPRLTSYRSTRSSKGL